MARNEIDPLEYVEQYEFLRQEWQERHQKRCYRILGLLICWLVGGAGMYSLNPQLPLWALTLSSPVFGAFILLVGMIVLMLMLCMSIVIFNIPLYFAGYKDDIFEL